ncbi:MAG: hypothetical protein MUP85_11530 [Candidatus Lokiarchaeota archaeon]|nr:hypothetical protein [Candidatus Lokiarchaeota archaeon]
MKIKVKGRFFKEITIDDDGDDIVYVFPDTKDFISILRRDINRKLISDEL